MGSCYVKMAVTVIYRALEYDTCVWSPILALWGLGKCIYILILTAGPVKKAWIERAYKVLSVEVNRVHVQIRFWFESFTCCSPFY